MEVEHLMSLRGAGGILFLTLGQNQLFSHRLQALCKSGHHLASTSQSSKSFTEALKNIKMEFK